MAILDGRHGVALAIFLAAATTDIFDGYLARRFGMSSPLGSYLDPIADKLLLVSTFVVFTLSSTPTGMHIPVWFLVLTIFRDLFIVVVSLTLYLAVGARSFPPSVLGKLTTFAEISTVVAILLGNVQALPLVVAEVCVRVAAALIVASGLHYIWRVSTGLRNHPAASPPPPAAP